jgi:hypothetical protein
MLRVFSARIKSKDKSWDKMRRHHLGKARLDRRSGTYYLLEYGIPITLVSHHANPHGCITKIRRRINARHSDVRRINMHLGKQNLCYRLVNQTLYFSYSLIHVSCS